MTETFKTELAALSLDMQRICEEQGSCYSCKYRNAESMCLLRVGSKYFDPEAAIAAVEAYRKRKKPCAEVVDKALDIYTIEVEVERGKDDITEPAQSRAERVKALIHKYYLSLYYNKSKNYAVRILSAKRFVLESHKEDEE